MKVRINLVIVLSGQLVPAAVDSWSLENNGFYSSHPSLGLFSFRDTRDAARDPVHWFLSETGLQRQCMEVPVMTDTHYYIFKTLLLLLFFLLHSHFSLLSALWEIAAGVLTLIQGFSQRTYTTLVIFLLQVFFFFLSYLYICLTC